MIISVLIAHADTSTLNLIKYNLEIKIFSSDEGINNTINTFLYILQTLYIFKREITIYKHKFDLMYFKMDVSCMIHYV